ncbi:MAG: hypothetical protein ACTHN0_00825 [Aquihabitans sp.]
MYMPFVFVVAAPIALVVGFFWGSVVARNGDRPLGLAITLTPPAVIVFFVALALFT